jgi:pyroglutamyl-peptidase
VSHILLGGFEPFAGDALNPSREVVKALDGRTLGGVAVRGLVLPVQHERARELLRPALAAPDLRAAVLLGLAGSRARVALECVGVNAMDYTTPDADGALRRGERCLADGPPAHFSTLPLPAILDALTGQGIPAHLSYTAGTYLCNFALYTALDALAARPAVPAGFIHRPYLPEMVAAHGREEPSMALDLMVRAVEITLEVTLSVTAGR